MKPVWQFLHQKLSRCYFYTDILWKIITIASFIRVYTCHFHFDRYCHAPTWWDMYIVIVVFNCCIVHVNLSRSENVRYFSYNYSDVYCIAFTKVVHTCIVMYMLGVQYECLRAEIFAVCHTVSWNGETRNDIMLWSRVKCNDIKFALYKNQSR